MSLMQVHVNGQPQIDYDRNKPLTDKQQQYLDKMDAGMDAGINPGKEETKEHDLQQRAEVVAGYLSQDRFAERQERHGASTSVLAECVPRLEEEEN